MSFKLRSLTLAVATFSAMSVHSAGLDRSGQDITAFLQDGDYADIIYTHIDADIKGKDTVNREVKDIAPSYDFFRYNVKTDVNDRISVGVLYDEPFGAKVQYQGVNNFAGDMDDFARPQLADFANDAKINHLNLGIAGLEQAHKDFLDKNGKTTNPKVDGAYTALNQLFTSNRNLLSQVKTDNDNKEPIQKIVNTIKAGLELSSKNQPNLEKIIAEGLADATISPVDKATISSLLGQLKAGTPEPDAVKKSLDTLELFADKGATSVEIHTRNLTGLVGVKLGEKKNIQVYAGPAFQKLEGEVHLRGNAYKGAGGYDAQITPDTAVGWVAGVAYSKPEIALKASLTYRSEIEHDTKIDEFQPLATIAGERVGQAIPQRDRRDFKVTLPESYNLDFQTGLSAKHRLLGTVKVRYVPWNDFAITPPLYNQVSKTVSKDGYNIVDYAKDQWSAEVGLGKQVNDKLAVSGSVGWDSGAGNPATSLGPVKGYYSLGLGAKYNITQNWALSAGAKYLKFGDATAQLPDKTNVGEFKDNDGYIVGLKLSYQNK